MADTRARARVNKTINPTGSRINASAAVAPCETMFFGSAIRYKCTTIFYHTYYTCTLLCTYIYYVYINRLAAARVARIVAATAEAAIIVRRCRAAFVVTLSLFRLGGGAIVVVVGYRYAFG